jgi:serine/threonine protein kinase
MRADRVEIDKLPELPDGQTEQIIEVLEEYLEQLESGNTPSQETLIAQHPEFANVLAEYLRELDRLHGAAADIRLPESNDPASPTANERGRLGDFKIVREIGRGGMGVVYEAEQISLDRRVALKVLPFAATLNARQLQRFKNEAQAAAQLHHSHIVPVYAVGCDRGVHYYAMQFIEGKSLAEIIADMRGLTANAGEGTAIDPPSVAHAPALQPTPGETPTRTVAAGPTERSTRATSYFSSVARLGIQAAEALEHAHQVGVVHRDIKPANVLVDTSEHVWITDFGLARFHAEGGLTLSGDVVGTLRYMSPEQALAKRALVDHRSDIYSLGATIYEALALQPPYPGSDRDELLRRLALDDPKPPRQIRPSIPLELETIVLKAMEREPERRYATAQELAEDLRRFLENRPILAARPTLLDRASKWARRHKPVLATAIVATVLAAVGLLACTILIWREKVQAQTNAAEARAQKQRAQANFEKALSGSKEILLHLEKKRWDTMPHIDELRDEVVDEGIRFFRQFIHEDSADPVERYESARAYQHLAGIYCARQDVDRAKDSMRRASALYEGLIAASPQESSCRRALAGTHYLMGLLCKSAGEREEAEKEFSKTAAICRQGLPYDADGEISNCLAWLLADCPITSLRDPAQAVAHAREAVARASKQGRFWNTLGVAHYRAGEFEEAVAALQKSIEVSGGGSDDWFFLAMAYKREGAEQQARFWYDKVTRWMDQNQALEESSMRYRAEAEQLFGATKKKD